MSYQQIQFRSRGNLTWELSDQSVLLLLVLEVCLQLVYSHRKKAKFETENSRVVHPDMLLFDRLVRDHHEYYHNGIPSGSNNQIS